MPRRPSQRKRIQNHMNRRQWLAMLGIGSAAGLAGCLGDGDSDDEGDGDTPSGDDGGDDGMSTDTPDEGLSTDTATPRQTDELPDVSGTYNSVTSAAYETLNPLFNTEAGAGTAISYALDSPYTFDGGQNYVPLLFDMSTDDGGKTWVFDIREGLEFGGDYGSVTAESFVYPVKNLHQKDWAPTAASPDWPANYEIEQTGELQFQVTLPTANLLWPRTYEPSIRPYPVDLLQPYVEEQDVEGMKQDSELLELQFTGNLGPYNLDEWPRGDGARYSRNEDYYLQDADDLADIFSEAPYFEGVETKVVKEQASRLNSLKTGEADSASIPPKRFNEFDQLDQVDVYETPQPYNEIIAINMRDNGWQTGPGNLFRHKEFRQAMACAINKQKLIEGVHNNLAEPHYTWQPKFSRFYPEDADLPTYGSGDLYGKEVAREKARQAFEKSEHDYSFNGDQLVTPEGNQVELDLYHSAGQETEKLQAEFAAQELGKNLGINVIVESIDGRKFSQDYWQGSPVEDPPAPEGLDREGWSVGPTNPGPRQVTSANAWDMSMVFGLNTFPRNPLTNNVFFDGPDVYYNPVGYYPSFNAEELFQQAREAESIEELKSAFSQIFVELAKDQPYIMLAFPSSTVGYNADLVGPIENFSNGWDFPAWYFEDE